MRWYGAFNLRLTLLQATLPTYSGSALTNEKANGLNQRRIAAQNEIFSLIDGYESVCESCGGLCCQEQVERYTPFDQHIHEALEQPLQTYDTRIYSPFWMISNGIKHVASRLIGRKTTPLPCPYLAPTGCSIEREKRPMICASWFCPKYLRSIDQQDMQKLSYPLREIEAIHHEIHMSARRTVGDPALNENTSGGSAAFNIE